MTRRRRGGFAPSSAFRSMADRVSPASDAFRRHASRCSLVARTFTQTPEIFSSCRLTGVRGDLPSPVSQGHEVAPRVGWLSIIKKESYHGKRLEGRDWRKEDSER